MGSDLMTRRREIFFGAEPPHGWMMKSFTADRRVTNGMTVTDLLRAELPNNYKYVVVLRNVILDPPKTNSFIGCVFVPTRNKPFIIRYRATEYNFVYEPDSGHDIVIDQGDVLTVYWKTNDLNTGVVPTVGWGYSPLFYGRITNAAQLQAGLETVANDNWNVMISVADLDFNTVPTVNRTFCCAFNVSNFTGNWIRTNGRAYQYVSNWTSAYDCLVDDHTGIACFYL